MTANISTMEDLIHATDVALTNVGTSRIGAKIPRTTDPKVRERLEDLGLITSTGGLTRTGSIMRDRIQRRDLDLLF